MPRFSRHPPSRLEALIDRLTRLALLPIKLIVLLITVIFLIALLKFAWRLAPVLDWFLSLL